MKKIYILIVLACISMITQAQSPGEISYQAVVRNADGNLVTTSVGMRLTILQGEELSSAIEVYEETMTPTPNQNGLISITFGGDEGWDTIQWANGPFFIKTETDIQGGTNYTIESASQLLSVPYALYSSQSDTLIGSIQESQVVYADTYALKSNVLTLDNTTEFVPDADYEPTTKKYVDDKIGGRNIGEEYLGGVIFYVYMGTDGKQHGLIVSKTEGTAKWQTTTSKTNALNTWNGKPNFNVMTDSPAKTWITNNFSEYWYLPSIDELKLLWDSRYHINKAVTTVQGLVAISNTAYYWSSTEYSKTYACAFLSNYGSTGFYQKAQEHKVRAVKVF